MNATCRIIGLVHDALFSHDGPVWARNLAAVLLLVVVLMFALCR